MKRVIGWTVRILGYLGVIMFSGICGILIEALAYSIENS